VTATKTTMVSLANDSLVPSGGSRGAFFFDDLAVENDDSPAPNANGRVYRPDGRGSINDAVDDDDVALLIPRPVNSTPSEDSVSDYFVTVKTPWILALECLIFIGLLVAAFLLPHFLHDDKLSTTVALPYFILMYAHGGMWFVVFLFDRILWSQHRKAQARGYLEFYRSTRTLRQAPLFIVSLFTAVLLLMATVLQQYPIHSSPSTSPPPRSSSSPTSPSSSYHNSYLLDLLSRVDENNLFQIVVTVEMVPALLCIAVLMIRTVHFNGLRHPPDVHQEEAMMQSTVPGLRGASSRDVGFRDASLLNVHDHGDYGTGRRALHVEELLEKQSDQIRYLKSHNANLSKKILRLTEELQNRH